jgi:hypothetical protein
MKKTMRASDMAKLASLAHQAGVNVTFKVLIEGKPRLLSSLRPDVTTKGNPSTRTIHLKQDGRAISFDGRYEFHLAEPTEDAVIFKKSK